MSKSEQSGGLSKGGGRPEDLSNTVPDLCYKHGPRLPTPPLNVLRTPEAWPGSPTLSASPLRAARPSVGPAAVEVVEGATGSDSGGPGTRGECKC